MGCSTSAVLLTTNGQAKTLPRQPRAGVGSIGVIGAAAAAVPNIHDVLAASDSSVKVAKIRELFEDPDFPADLSSLMLKDPLPEDLEWRRPQDICENPQLFLDGSNRSDVMQGYLGDCWMLAAMSALAQYPHLLHKVLDPTQVLSGPNYDGCLRIRLWKFGRWRTILIDDRLPVHEGKELLFARCPTTDELWAPLLEKAYAKFHGTYGALKGGVCIESLTCLTGGLSEIIDVKEVEPDDLCSRVSSALVTKAVITCGKFDELGEGEKDEDGLVSGHAYTVTGASDVELADGGSVMLMRVRNPWGNDTEWTGAWSDGDAKWDQVNPKVRASLEEERPNGEFWISAEDFHSEFQIMTISNLMPDLDGDGDGDEGVSGQVEGLWDEQNKKPCQLLLRLQPISEGDEESTPCSVILALMQEPVRGTSLELKGVGFRIHKAQKKTRRAVEDLPEEVENTGEPGAYEELTKRFQLEPGDYIVVPYASDLESEEKRHFLFRAYAASGLLLLSLAYTEKCGLTHQLVSRGASSPII